jgi:hypothetical protein
MLTAFKSDKKHFMTLDEFLGRKARRDRRSKKKTTQTTPVEMGEYEQKRKARIADNDLVLAKLGIQGAQLSMMQEGKPNTKMKNSVPAPSIRQQPGRTCKKRELSQGDDNEGDSQGDLQSSAEDSLPSASESEEEDDDDPSGDEAD